MIKSGIFSYIYLKNVSIFFKYHGPKAIITTNTKNILKPLLKVCSCIEDNAWNKLILTPTIKAVPSKGEAKETKVRRA